MSVNLRFGHLADYATVNQQGKLILAGIFDVVLAQGDDTEIVPVAFTLVAGLTCSLADGFDHQVSVRFCDAEEEQIGNEVPVGLMTFIPSGPGRPLTLNMLVRFAGLQIRGVDDYNFVIVVDANPVGQIPLYVQRAPEMPSSSGDV